MFRKKKRNDNKERRVAKDRKQAAQRAQAEQGISIIGPGTRIVGDVKTEGSIRVEGQVDGTIQAGKAVVLAEGGEIRGEIVTADAVIGGRLDGSLTAHSRLEIQGTSEIEGEVRARAQHIQIEEGARFNGRIAMLEEGQEVRSLPPSEPPATEDAAEEKAEAVRP